MNQGEGSLTVTLRSKFMSEYSLPWLRQGFRHRHKGPLEAFQRWAQGHKGSLIMTLKGSFCQRSHLHGCVKVTIAREHRHEGPLEAF